MEWPAKNDDQYLYLHVGDRFTRMLLEGVQTYV